MKVKDYLELQFKDKNITIYKGGRLSDPILYKGMNQDLKDESILDMEVARVSGAADQTCGIRFFA